ncbi:LamG-like jellyroll fold domain-containing protein [Streptomyces sp. NPDC051320]|uniref:LamG-like jellyroll fold domain-containing protein n=1 Tax=Streptomyces sp. NPDC051320 TaxID=3154644 RepID=UPI00344716A4
MGPVSGAGTASAADAPVLTEGQQALAAAEKSGQRVEVLGERTDRSTVFANPDGSTFTLEQSTVPVRVAKPDGGWQAPDPTLVKRADGTVGPKAAAVDMSFSGGGSDRTLARIADAGKSLALSWPDKLPVPVLDGASAVYGDVLPDVDLKVTATAESFQHVLVVKSAQAAADPGLKKLEFGLKTSGLKVESGAAGNLSAVDGNGNTVFRAPPAQMWNSAGQSGTDQSGTAAQPAGGVVRRSVASASVTESAAGSATPGDPSESAASGSGLHPGQGDDVARMDVQVSKDALSVVPDAQMLQTASSGDFPVFIDPTVTWGESERTLLRSDGYESYGWGNGSDDRGMGAGKCGTWSGYYCGPGYVQRLYFEFSPSSLKGKKVLDATFRVTEPWAFQCSPRTVDLIRTPDNISSSTTWASRPQGGWDTMVDRSVSAGRGSLCDPDSPDAPIEFNDSPSEPNENLTPTVQSFAAGKFSRLTLMLKAHDETDTSAWKRFKNDAVLSVDFVGLPAKPSGIGVNVGNKPVCETSASDPLITSDPTPALMATAQTASGGEKDAQLRIYFDVDQLDATGAWKDSPETNGDLRPSTGYVGDGAHVTLPWSTLAEGTLYRYRAWVRSYYDGSKYLAGPSNASTTGWCYFKVDPARPHGPTVKVGTPYTECTSAACVPGGGPGMKGTFTFTPASVDGDVTGYEYKLSSSAAWVSAGSGTSVSVTLTPQDAGTERLYVRARDSIGWGAQSVVDFLVAAGAGPIAQWHFNEGSGVAVDSATGSGAGGHDATLAGGAVRDDRGRRGLITKDVNGASLATPVTDKGLKLDGSSGYAATSGQVLETRSSYTVSAWVRLEDGSRNRTIVSQDGVHRSPFYLGYEQSAGKWDFRAVNADAAVGTTWSYQRVWSKNKAVLGAWTQLTGVFDASAKTVTLYVNGLPQGSVPYTTAWAATGPLQIGRTHWSDTYTDYADGSVDEVSVWQRALTAQEAADQAHVMTSEKYAGAELVANWNPAGRSGSTLADTVSGYGKTLTLSGGASLDGESIVLDGTDGAATATGPLVDDTGSFTVTTLAALDSEKLAAKDIGYTGQVLGQRTADGSAWGLWFELTGKKTVVDEGTLEEKIVPVGKWHFGRLNSDGTFSSVISDDVAETDGPVRLAGVFDAQAGTISLDVGRVQNDEPKVFTAAAGVGDFAVGKGYTGGGWGHYLPARITDVRVWAGAMASPEQIEETVGD